MIRSSEPAWHDRLISRAEVLARTEQWPLRLGRRENGSIHLECARCEQSAGLLSQGGTGTANMASWVVTTGELVSAVLRHMVTAHDEHLGSHDGP